MDERPASVSTAPFLTVHEMSKDCGYAVTLQKIDHTQQHGLNLHAVAAFQEGGDRIEDDETGLESGHLAQHHGQMHFKAVKCRPRGYESEVCRP